MILLMFHISLPTDAIFVRIFVCFRFTFFRILILMFNLIKFDATNDSITLLPDIGTYSCRKKMLLYLS